MKRLTVEAALKIVAPHAEALYSIPMDAWTEYHADMPKGLLVSFGPRTRASAVHDLMVANATRYAATTNGEVRMFEHRQMMGMVIAGLLAIKFKKIDEENQSRNQPTKQIEDFRGQQQIDGLETLHNLELGHVLNEHQTQIVEVRLVYPSGDGVYWSTKIGDGGAEPSVVELFPPSVDPNPPKPPSIKPKKSGAVIPLRKKDGKDGNEN